MFFISGHSGVLVNALGNIDRFRAVVTLRNQGHDKPQAAQTLFVIFIRDCIALRFEPFKRMYENGSKIAVNLTCSKGFK